jgi:hypothetical protein
MGEAGPPGANADASIVFAALVTITPEPIGERCDAGGKRIDVGIDNGDGNGIAEDGVLQPGEIDDTQYVCNGIGGPDLPQIVEGNYTINNSIDVALLQGVTEITGNLSVNITGLHALELPNLVGIGHELEIGDNTELTTVSLPSLKTVGIPLPLHPDLGSSFAGNGNALRFHDNSVLTAVDLSALTSVGGDVVIIDNSLLTTTAWLSSLHSVDGEFVARGASLTTLSLPALTTLGGRIASDTDGKVMDDTLITISCPLLTTEDSLIIDQAQALQTVNLPSLVSSPYGVSITDSDALQTVTLTNLTSVGMKLDISGNAVLSDLDLASLATLTGANTTLTITQNPSLPQCDVDAIEAQVTPAPTTVTTCCNLGTCP